MKTDSSHESSQESFEEDLIAEEGAAGAVVPVAGAELAALRRSGSWYVLRNRDYALLFWGQLIS
ncbi:MAG: hypothetical protein ACHQ4H_08670, partial [Ktedonobacterales bacterium]